MMKELRFIGGLGLLTLLVFMASCYKVENTFATITVTDKNGKALPNTEIHVFPNPTEPANPPAELNQELDQFKISDHAGKVEFDFTEFYQRGQVGLFVLNIEATSGDTLMIPGIIKIVEQEHNYETIKFPFEL
jgi:hypothetical protein